MSMVSALQEGPGQAACVQSTRQSSVQKALSCSKSTAEIKVWQVASDVKQSRQDNGSLDHHLTFCAGAWLRDHASASEGDTEDEEVSALEICFMPAS